jgi:hypothetical protein
MDLTSRLNVLPFSDVDTRNSLLGEILGKPLPATVTIYPPFYSDYGLGISWTHRRSDGMKTLVLPAIVWRCE